MWFNKSMDSKIKGMAWFHFSNDKTIGFEWIFLRPYFGISIDLGGEESNELCLHIAIPFLFSFWIYFEGFAIGRYLNRFCYKRKWYDGIKTSIRIHNNTIWWSFLVPERYGSPVNQNISILRCGNFDFADFFLGRIKHTSKITESYYTSFLVPGCGEYKPKTHNAKYTKTVNEWKRPRWFRTILNRVELKMIEPIPHPGKGTCSYNCGEDALHSINLVGETLMDAIQAAIDDVTYKRKNYPL